MIAYNFPHRGAFEYDKFVLSTLQYYNETVLLKTNIDKGIVFDAKTIREEVAELFDECVKNSPSRRMFYLFESINI